MLDFWILQIVAMIVTIFLIPRLRVSGLFGAFCMVAGIALVNAFLWDAALFYALPDTVSTRAALLLVANGLIFWVLAKVLPGVEVDGVMPAVAAPVVFTVSSVLIHRYGNDVDWPTFFRGLGQWIIESMRELRTFIEAQ